MTTATRNRVRETKVFSTKDHPAIYATPTGVKFGSKGKVLTPGVAFGLLDKSDARKVRKALRAKGKANLAREPRVNDSEFNVFDKKAS